MIAAIRTLAAAVTAGVLAAACTGLCSDPADVPALDLAILTPEPTPTVLIGEMDVLTVSIGEARLRVEVAATEQQRQRGLSERKDLGRFDGMLFHPDGGRMTALWMKGMQFDLDFVWIGDDCRVVDIHHDVPAPERPGDATPIYRPGAVAGWVIEIAGGRSVGLGISAGQHVKYSESAMERSYGCE